MHSRVFSVTVGDEKREHDFFLTSELESNDFVGNVADYIMNVKDNGVKNEPEFSIKRLVDYLEYYLGDLFKFDSKDNSFIFAEGFKQKFFKNIFEKLKDIINNMTLEEFSGCKCEDYPLDNVERLINDEYGYYIYTDEYNTLDEFIRFIAEPGVKYTIGDIVDYHY